jgi:hypothetical protein
MANIYLKYLSAPPKRQPAPGTEAWCASKLGGLSGVIAKYRFLTGNSEFDEFLDKETSPYIRFRLHGELNSLVSALQQNAEGLRINFEGYTSEVRYTDRVLRFPALFGDNGILVEPVTTIHVPNPSLLYSTVTGDPGSAGYFPLNAVRWLTPPRNIAVLVTESASGRFTAELFHFGEKKRPMSAEFNLLSRGKYELTIAVRDGSPQDALRQEQELLGTDEPRPSDGRGEFVVEGRRTRVSFTLPPRKLCVLRIRRR